MWGITTPSSTREFNKIIMTHGSGSDNYRDVKGSNHDLKGSISIRKNYSAEERMRE